MNLDVLFDASTGADGSAGGGTSQAGRVDVPRLAEVLDGLGHIGRVATIRGWGHAHQEKLYEAVSDFKPLGLADFVPDDVEPMVEVIHWGKNSLPAFTHFKKRFCKGTTQGELWGYNDNGESSHQFATGPGYFVVHAPERPDALTSEVDIDYRKLPPSKPDNWPPIKPNEAGLSRFIYAGMTDVMRGISKHVTIGRALKGGQFMDAYFVLCRDDGPVPK
jgi:hypothetical protein